MTLLDSPDAIATPIPEPIARRGPQTAASPVVHATQTGAAGGADSPDAIVRSQPMPRTRRGPKTAASQAASVTQTPSAGGAGIPDANGRTEPIPAPRPGADPGTAPASAAADTIEISPVLSLDDPFLYLAAAVLDDAQQVRTANANRLRILTTPKDKLDADGVPRGWGLPTDHPDVVRVAALVAALERVEHDATLNLQRLMRRHPLGSWVKANPGVGEKQAARLLACIGDPYWNSLHNRPRTVSQLWAYCGLHVLPAGHPWGDAQLPNAGGDQTGGDLDHRRIEPQPSHVGVAAKRRKGIRANWSTDAKTRAYLIAEKVVMQNGAPDKNGNPRALSPYRAVYDNRRAHTATTHPDWTAGHSHNDALRIVSKAILKDLWLAARELHEAR